MRAQEFIFERETVPFQGIDMSLEREEDEIMVRASAGGRPLGSVLFIDYDGALMPQDLEVDERYRGQGIAAAMYDYVKSQGYRIRRSGQQTDAGAGFWARHRPDSNVWEQGVTEVSEIRTPAYLYHATYRPLLKSIKQHGLGGDNAQAKWEDSKPGVIYLATDPNVAESYAETSDVVPEEWLDQIVILKISTKGLENKIQIDKNVQDNEGDTLEYHGIIPLSNISMYKQGVTEVKILSKVKGKGANPDQLPNRGREINVQKVQQQLGRYVSDIDSDHAVYRDQFGGQITYNLLNKNTRRSTLTVFGSRYPGNADSFIVSGLYASPDNDIPAAEFYRHLILDLGLTLISDRKQSPGGQRVWQRLEQLPGIEVYGYDTATGDVLNIGAKDEEMYAVPAAAAQGREMGKIARDIRLVATAR